MAGRFNVENASEEVFEFVCGPCHEEGEMLQAKGYCSNCQDYLCDICLKQHLRPKPMRHHVLLDEKSMPKDKKAKSTNVKASDTCTEICPKHSSNIIEYYCQSHDFLGCTKCFISDNHRMCKGVVCIADATDGLYKSREYKTYTGKIENISNDLTKSSSIQQKNEGNIKMYSIRAKKEIQNFRKSINEFLDRLENDMDKQVSQMQESQTSKMISISKQVEQLDNDIKTIKRTTEQSKKSGQMCNSYINMKSNLNQLKQLEDCMVKINEENEVSEYIFKLDASLHNIIKDTKKFGKLVTRKGDEAGYAGLTPSTTSTRKIAHNPTNTQALRDNSALIDALQQRLYKYSIYNTYRDIYTDAIASVKAGRRVDFDRLPTHLDSRFPFLPKGECDAYNKFHGYY